MSDNLLDDPQGATATMLAEPSLSQPEPDAASTKTTPPSPLTPRSKVRALLAAFDDASSSDDDNNGGGVGDKGQRQKHASLSSASEARSRSSDPRKTATPGTQPGANTQSTDDDTTADGGEDSNGSEEKEEEDVAARPRGRLAQRMFGSSLTGRKKEKKDGVNDEKGEAEEEADGEQAKTADAPQPNKVSSYERVKRQLMHQQPPPLTVLSKEHHGPAADSAPDSENDEIIRPAPSRLVRSKRTLVRHRRSPKPSTPQAPSAGASGPPSPSQSPSPAPSAHQASGPDAAAYEGGGGHSSDSDLPDEPHADARFLASVAQLQRKKQAEKAAAAAERAAQEGVLAPASLDSDSAVETRLTQQARPTRKASKKALEEMTRETQRLARNMHLQHEARTKKRITKQSLFERFNFRPAAASTTTNATTATTATHSDLLPPVSATIRQSGAMDPGHPATSSTMASDAENPRSSTTAPSSPPSSRYSSPQRRSTKPEDTVDTTTAQVADVPMDEDLPSLNDVMAAGPPATSGHARPATSSSSPAIAKTLGAAISGQRPRTDSADRANSEATRSTAAAAASTKARTGGGAKHTLNRAALRQRLSASAAARRQQHMAGSGDDDDADDDSELEIVPVSKARAVLSEHAPLVKEEEPPSLHVLRACAQLNAPESAPSKTAGATAAAAAAGKATMSFAALQAALRQQARQQAARERQARVEELKSRGVVLQTAEERAQEEATIEELLDRARDEAERLRKKERAGAKDGVRDILDDGSDDDDDGDYEGDADDDDDDNADDAQDVEPYVSEAEDSEENDAGEGESLVEEEAEVGSDEEEEEENKALDDDDRDSNNGKKESPGLNVDDSDVDANNKRSASPSRDKKHEGTGEHLAGDANRGRIQPDILTPVRRRRRRTGRIVIDDDDDAEEDVENAEHQATPAPTVQVPESARKPLIPGLPVSKGPLLSLTQMFALTMPDDDSRQALQEERDDAAAAAVAGFSASAAEGHLDLPSDAPVIASSSFSEFAAFPAADTAGQTRKFVADSQPAERSRNDGGGFGGGNAVLARQGMVRVQATQEDDYEEEGLEGRLGGATQKSDYPELTQDVGLSEARLIPANVYRNPASTIDTVLVDGGSERAPSPRPALPSLARKGRVLRGLRHRSASPAGNEDGAAARDDEAAGAFDVMLQAAAKQRAATAVAAAAAADTKPFNKKTSRARALVDEMAEESEDEYAGLGGASDDDGGASDGGDSDASNLLDDEAQDVRVEDLAALMADRDRAEDKKQLEKIFNDVTTGAFRRKRGVGFDLSDSDDGEEARRIMKRRKEIRMRRALLADEKLEKIATNPKKSAFFRSIEDHDADDDDDIDGLDFYGEASQPPPDSQQQQRSSRGGGSEEEEDADGIMNGSRKRKHASAWPGENENQQPPPAPQQHRAKRRAAAAARGTRRRSISELRQTLSELVAPPNTLLAAAVATTTTATSADYGASDDNDDDHDDGGGDGIYGGTRGFAKGETAPGQGRGKGSRRVIDRLSAMRNAHQHQHHHHHHNHSAAAAVHTATTTRLAFTTTTATTTNTTTATTAVSADDDLFLRLPPSFRPRTSAQAAIAMRSSSSSSSMHVINAGGAAYGGIAAASVTTATATAAAASASAVGSGPGTGSRTVLRHAAGAVVAVPRKKGKMKMASISAFAVRSTRMK